MIKDTLTYSAEQKTIVTRLGDADGVANADIKVGGSDPAKFLPNVNMSKWNDECWLNLNIEDLSVSGSEVVSNIEEKYMIGSQAMDISYRLEDEKLGWGFILKQRPKNDRIRIKMDYSPGMTFNQTPSWLAMFNAEFLIRSNYKT